MLKVQISQDTPMPLHVDLECLPGELHALVGPSGSGKTSVLRTIAGLRNPSSGLIQCGTDIWFDSAGIRSPNIALSPAKRSCGFLFQQYALFPHLTALENVCISLQNSGLNSPQQKSLALNWLERMGITDLVARMPNQLSGGQQQRVALARALARQPKILLLDEPFSAVDAPIRQSLYKTLADLRKDLNIPILLVTHDLREADLLADRITVIDEGMSLQTAAPKVLFQKPRNSRVAELVGIHNMFTGIFNSGNLTWDGCDKQFKVIDKGKIPSGTPVAWVIPPEGLSLHQDSSNTGIPAAVENISALGQIAVIQLRIKDSDHRITWEASAAEVKRLSLDIGRSTYLELDESKIHIMPLRPINDPRHFRN